MSSARADLSACLSGKCRSGFTALACAASIASLAPQSASATGVLPSRPSDQTSKNLSVRMAGGTVVALEWRQTPSDATDAEALPALRLALVGATRGRSSGSRVVQATLGKAAPASALISRPQVHVQTWSATWNDQRLTLLMHVPASGAQRLLGVIVSGSGSRADESSYFWYRQQQASASTLDLAGLEHLYRLGLEQDPLRPARFQMVVDGRADARPTVGKRLTHSALLAAIATARERIATKIVSSGEKLVRWKSAYIELRGEAKDETLVRARVRDASRRPVLGASISFTQAPHFGCTAQSDASGLAACHLEDTHGHEDHHGETAPTVAYFAGKVDQDEIVLPTTAVLGTSHGSQGQATKRGRVEKAGHGGH
jgi:hypothetical protein